MGMLSDKTVTEFYYLGDSVPLPSNSLCSAIFTSNSVYTPAVPYNGFSEITVSVDTEPPHVKFNEYYTSKITTYENESARYVFEAAFENNNSLNYANLPNCVYVDCGAFSNAYRLSSVSLPKCEYIGPSAFYFCTHLQSISLPACTFIDHIAFGCCYSLSSVYIPHCSSLSYYAFSSCSSLAYVYAPAVLSFDNPDAFRDCKNLSYIRLEDCSYIGNYAFRSLTGLLSLYLLSTSVVTLEKSNAFLSTPIAGYIAAVTQYGSVYVPSDLLANYKTATNWSYFSARMVGV